MGSVRRTSWYENCSVLPAGRLLGASPALSWVILQLLAKAQIVSPGTVKKHVRHIIAKLEVSDRTQAAVRAIELGLLTSR